MTWSVLGRCTRSGQLGIATTTSDIGVGARVPWVYSGVGAAATQHRTDPRLGPALLEALVRGKPAAVAVADVAAAAPHARWRQLAVLPTTGPGAVWSGDLVDAGGATEVHGDDHLVAGNALSSPAVAQAAGAAFDAAAGEPLTERLLVALEAGLVAGGERSSLRSAAMLVHGPEVFPLVSLRVDEHVEPLTELRRLWTLYRPLQHVFVARVHDPDHLPEPATYGGC